MTQRIKIFFLQQYEERIEKLSQQDKLSKFCMDAGFLSVGCFDGLARITSKELAPIHSVKSGTLQNA